MSSRTIAARLGERLRALRLRAGLTQQDLADRVGISPPEISKYELARRTPSLESLASLADGLGLPLAEVMAIEGPENASPELQRILRRLHGQPEETLELVGRLIDVVTQDPGGVVQLSPRRRESPR